MKWEPQHHPTKRATRREGHTANTHNLLVKRGTGFPPGLRSYSGIFEQIEETRKAGRRRRRRRNTDR